MIECQLRLQFCGGHSLRHHQVARGVVGSCALVCFYSEREYVADIRRIRIDSFIEQWRSIGRLFDDRRYISGHEQTVLINEFGIVRIVGCLKSTGWIGGCLLDCVHADRVALFKSGVSGTA